MASRMELDLMMTFSKNQFKCATSQELDLRLITTSYPGQRRKIPYLSHYPLLAYIIIFYFILMAAMFAQSVKRVTAKGEVAGSISGAGPVLRVLK